MRPDEVDSIMMGRLGQHQDERFLCGGVSSHMNSRKTVAMQRQICDSPSTCKPIADARNVFQSRNLSRSSRLPDPEYPSWCSSPGKES